MCTESSKGQTSCGRGTMVISGSYDALYFQEIANHFFGVGSSSYIPADTREQDTFLHLLETSDLLALDYLNCWLSLQKTTPKITDKNLIYIKKADILKEKLEKRKKKKKGKR